MSSLAATQADGFYFPPEWTPAMGGLSKYQGSKGANQYQQYGIVRFELPFDGWCLKCERHICKGHRFNAKKDKIGKYFSTTLFSFSTKCPSVECDQKFVIKTDPENRTYDFADGLRKMVQDFVPGADDSIIETTSEETKILIENDPMYKLQHDKVGKIKADAAKTVIDRLIAVQDEQFKNDFDSNSLLRKRHREVKHRNNDLLQAGNEIGLAIPLAEPSESDIIGAKRANFKPSAPNSFQASERLKFAQLIGESIFSKPKSNFQADSKKRKLDNNPNIKSSDKSRPSYQMTGYRKKCMGIAQAMKKQAVLKLDTKNFKIGEPATSIDSKSIRPISLTAVRKIETCSAVSTNIESDAVASKMSIMLAGYDSCDSSDHTQ